ncbi:alcohol dehydrogenase catalytic domain-containing protein [bacterium]|nr:alcohol dehydrogenase catalytic domain-containing protein [bacterium]
MSKTMKAQIFYEPENMKLEEVPVPEIGLDEVLVRVKACGICGSDIAYYYGDSSLETETGKGPLIIGHEFSGEVVEVGSIPADKGLFAPGDRVVVDPLQYCYACEICKKGEFNLCEYKNVLGVSHNGGFAEYCASHYTGLHKVPDNVSYVEAAMTEPLADAVYAVQKMSVKLGDFCVVIGPGAIGIMMVQLIKSSGAGTVVLAGTRDYRLEVGKDAGADLIINTADEKSPYYVADLKAKIEELTDGKFADAVVTPTGSVEAMEMALEISGRRARIVYFGLPSDEAVIRVHALSAIFWDKSILFSWLAPLTWPIALKAIATELVDVKKLHTHTFKLEDLVQGLADVKARKGNVMKAIVEP